MNKVNTYLIIYLNYGARPVMKTKQLDPLVATLIKNKRTLLCDGAKVTMREQCRMHPTNAVTWQAALILEGKRSIITRSQTKLDKASGQQWINRGLTLSPANEASPYFKATFNHCPFASPGCIPNCVGSKTGQGTLPSSEIARIGRTLAMHYDFARFFQLLRLEIERELARCKKLGTLAFRTNVASDNTALADELCKLYDFSHRIIFYDYTVVPKALGTWDRSGVMQSGWSKKPFVYRVYSRKENNHDKCLDVLASGHGVAVVFADGIPPTWNGYPVIDGDVNDLWFTRAPRTGGFVVGLKVKGSNKQKQDCIASGFAV